MPNTFRSLAASNFIKAKTVLPLSELLLINFRNVRFYNRKKFYIEPIAQNPLFGTEKGE